MPVTVGADARIERLEKSCFRGCVLLLMLSTLIATIVTAVGVWRLVDAPSSGASS